MATRKGPSPSMDNNLMTIADIPVDQVGHFKKAQLRSKKGKGNLKVIVSTSHNSKSTASVPTKERSNNQVSRNVRKKKARRKKGRSEQKKMSREEDIFGMLAKRRSENKLVGSAGDHGVDSIPSTSHNNDPSDGGEDVPREKNVSKPDSLSTEITGSTIASVVSINIFEELNNDENNSADLPQFDIKQFENIRVNRH